MFFIPEDKIEPKCFEKTNNPIRKYLLKKLLGNSCDSCVIRNMGVQSRIKELEGLLEIYYERNRKIRDASKII